MSDVELRPLLEAGRSNGEMISAKLEQMRESDRIKTDVPTNSVTNGHFVHKLKGISSVLPFEIDMKQNQDNTLAADNAVKLIHDPVRPSSIGDEENDANIEGNTEGHTDVPYLSYPNIVKSSKQAKSDLFNRNTNNIAERIEKSNTDENNPRSMQPSTTSTGLDKTTQGVRIYRSANKNNHMSEPVPGIPKKNGVKVVSSEPGQSKGKKEDITTNNGITISLETSTSGTTTVLVTTSQENTPMETTTLSPTTTTKKAAKSLGIHLV